MPYILIAISLFAIDSMIKAYIEKNKEIGEVDLKCHGKIAIKKYHNRGAILNLGEEKQSFIAYFSLICTVLVSCIFAVIINKKDKVVLKTGLALILGGAYSNTYDRIRRKYVVDYLSFPMRKYIGLKKLNNTIIIRFLEKFGTVVFNISDFGIIIGSILLIASEQNIDIW